jgi:hypothetical protein
MLINKPINIERPDIKNPENSLLKPDLRKNAQRTARGNNTRRFLEKKLLEVAGTNPLFDEWPFSQREPSSTSKVIYLFISRLFIFWINFR